MELHELQKQWDTMSTRIDQLEIVSRQQIMEITNQKYKNRFKRFWIFESAGAIVCFVFALLILVKFELMDTLFLKATAILTVIVLIVMPVFVLKSLYQVKSLKWSLDNYKTVLLKFQKSKKRLFNLQRLSMPFSVVVLFTTIPVMNKLTGNDNFMESLDTSVFVSIGVALVFVILFSLWGAKKYKKSLDATEKMIDDIERQD